MDYRVAFDVAEAGCRFWWLPLIGVGAVVVGLLRLRHRRRNPGPRPSRWRSVGPAFEVVVGLLLATGAFLGTYGQYRGLVRALENRDYVVVEGVVHDFVPMPVDGHPNESFEVAGRRYEYSDFMVTQAFNNTQSHGGPMRDGLRVRIADVSGRIARLEIAR